MKLKDLVVGNVYVFDGGVNIAEAEVVELIQIYSKNTSLFEVKVKPLEAPESEVFNCDGYNLLTLEEADHELFLLIKQAETLRQEVKAQLHLKLCQ
jgi:hypothetical protein